MRRVTALFLGLLLLAGSVLPHVSAERLPGLIEHYHEHQREEGADLNVFHFLWEHYAADAFHHNHPNHSHSHLPALDCHAAAHLFVWPVPGFRFAKPLALEGPARLLPRWENHYAFAFARALLNPPKEP
jgi:hypothetical protein